MFWGADGYAHKTSNNLKKRTLDGYTGHNFPIFGDRKVTNIFSTDQIFFYPNTRNKRSYSTL